MTLPYRYPEQHTLLELLDAVHSAYTQYKQDPADVDLRALMSAYEDTIKGLEGSDLEAFVVYYPDERAFDSDRHGSSSLDQARYEFLIPYQRPTWQRDSSSVLMTVALARLMVESDDFDNYAEYAWALPEEEVLASAERPLCGGERPHRRFRRNTPKKVAARKASKARRNKKRKAIRRRRAEQQKLLAASRAVATGHPAEKRETQ